MRWLVLALLALVLDAQPVRAQFQTLDQGPAWTAATRSAFYTQDQGSRLIPLKWLANLRGPDGAPFLQGGLQRYGYLAPISASGLPVGFATGTWQRETYAGMTCAACHTRQISVGSVAYRVDGGPALADFQSFLRDLDAAVLRVLSDEAALAQFAAGVLGPDSSASGSAALRDRVQAWYAPYHQLMAGALPMPPHDQPWGPGRLDAVGMIFDRLTGLDIGRGADRTIAANIRTAGAPARYPFLWNVSIQDRTDWPGFSGNGNEPLALARNLGEVYGVFGIFTPTATLGGLGMDYKTGNSANFDGLRALERLVQKIGPPRWPGPLDRGLFARGSAVWAAGQGEPSCQSCHGIVSISHGPLLPATWKTPLFDVGTDSREWDVLAWHGPTGVLEGAYIPIVADTRLKPDDTAFNVLATSVVGAILEHDDPLAIGRSNRSPFAIEGALAEAFHPPADPATREGGPFHYEARVLQGIWAAAPYLHNGTVPTLADLLEPPEQRPAAFRIGPVYDMDRVGLATDQAPGPTLQTTGCDARNSGNSRCGHDYGTRLPAPDKRALLEYLKGL